jgi:hypothetical protein
LNLSIAACRLAFTVAAAEWRWIVSVTSVVNLNDGLLGQPSAQQTQGSAASNATSLQASVSALPQDSFTPSAASESGDSTAQAAGLFNAPTTSGLPANATSTTLQAGGPSNLGSSTSNANTQSAPSAAADSTAPASAAPGSASQQTQVNTLNNALAALGLSAADIRQIDRVASLINDFNPTAFTSLAYQLEAQAQSSTTSSRSAQGTQSAVAGASAVGATSTSTAATPPALQSFSSSSRSKSNSESPQ